MKRREFIAVLAAVIPGARLLLPAYAQTRGIRRRVAEMQVRQMAQMRQRVGELRRGPGGGWRKCATRPLRRGGGALVVGSFEIPRTRD